ncbi:hypothetical protein N6H18_05285 [Reichenbachiella agarivorans]|uniref:PepSY domain-containing protein n=1 Tax=Reichenbachiella agarivorans TaxID=2979464 RepID=A0ABY6CSQ7_9BACT|nr:hypothetical protein [Reichenbachiella agarivorans]UXP33364.1 hypothetical protein N6H18_05285 [Reichenbachiella agarivorans]
MKNVKRIFASLMMSVAVMGTAFAQTATPTEEMDPTQDQTQMVESQDQDKTAIAMEEVPEAVQEGLQDSNIETAAVEEAYKVDLTDETLYEFVVTAEGVRWAIQFDEEGNYVNKKAIS